MNTGTSATSSSTISQGAKAIRPAAKLSTVTMSCSWPNIWVISVTRPVVCRRARSSWSWNSASSKSSRSSVRACSIRLTLDSLVRRSDSRLSTSITTLPIMSARMASANSTVINTVMRSNRPLASHADSVVGWSGICASLTTSSMISLPT